ncbi:MAG: hypothetical protein ACREVN_05015 [Gammaproteobacteria bacterium]
MSAVAAMLLLAGCCGYGDLFRPHPLEIAGDAQGCPTSVEKREGYICINNAGEEGLCAHPGDWVEWSRAESGGFEIEFTGYASNAERREAMLKAGESLVSGRAAPLVAERIRSSSNPMEEDCELTTENQSLKCRIAEDAAEGTYKYSVIVEDCEVLDPRIIIR